MRKPSLRRCAGCREMIDKRTLVRVAHYEGTFTVDPTGKAPGRGAYICRSEACLNQAQKSKGFERSFKSAISDEVYERLAALLRE